MTVARATGSPLVCACVWEIGPHDTYTSSELGRAKRCTTPQSTVHPLSRLLGLRARYY